MRYTLYALDEDAFKERNGQPILINIARVEGKGLADAWGSYGKDLAENDMGGMVFHGVTNYTVTSGRMFKLQDGISVCTITIREPASKTVLFKARYLLIEDEVGATISNKYNNNMSMNDNLCHYIAELMQRNFKQ